MRRILLVFTFALALTGGSTASAATVDLYAFKTISGVEYAQAAAYFSFRFCHQATGVCYVGALGSTGNTYFSVGYVGNYDLYLYRDYGVNYGGEWGSLSQAIAGGPYYVPSQFTSISASVPPRPLPPDVVTPCDNCYIPSSNFYLKWTDGLDAPRETSSWPVTYDIWASETPVGWPTQPENLIIPDAPCNADANGNCQWYVDALIPESGRRYTWRIVVKLQVGSGVVYETSGPSWRLTQY